MQLVSILEREEVIHSDPEIMSGTPVFVGSRVPLQIFFDYLEGPDGLSEFVNDFPYLEKLAIKVLENVAKLVIIEARQNNAYLVR
jgi:uncharacterized protein (DUF433 family)